MNDPGNYRGISLTDISSKIYGTIINKRIQKWVDEYNITGEGKFKQGSKQDIRRLTMSLPLWPVYRNDFVTLVNVSYMLHSLTLKNVSIQLIEIYCGLFSRKMELRENSLTVYGVCMKMC